MHRHFNQQMFHISRCFITQILAQVDKLPILSHVLSRHLIHPIGNSSRKKTNLQLLLLLMNRIQNSLNVFFEPEFKH